MTPVFQRVSDKGRGDCFSAALASILDLSYDDVPAFVTEAFDFGQPHRWDDAAEVWLHALGLRLLVIPWKDFNDWRGLHGAYAILSVPSQRFPGGSHAVVCTWVPTEDGRGSCPRIVHDPSPWNEPYVVIAPTFVKFIVPLVPRIPAGADIAEASRMARLVLTRPVLNAVITPEGGTDMVSALAPRNTAAGQACPRSPESLDRIHSDLAALTDAQVAELDSLSSLRESIHDLLHGLSPRAETTKKGLGSSRGILTTVDILMQQRAEREAIVNEIREMIAAPPVLASR